MLPVSSYSFRSAREDKTEQRVERNNHVQSAKPLEEGPGLVEMPLLKPSIFITTLQLKGGGVAEVFASPSGSFKAVIKDLKRNQKTVDIVTDNMTCIEQKLRSTSNAYLMSCEEGGEVLYLGKYGLSGGGYFPETFYEDSVYGVETAEKMRALEGRSWLVMGDALIKTFVPPGLAKFGYYSYTGMSKLMSDIKKEDHIEALEAKGIQLESLIRQLVKYRDLPIDQQVAQFASNPVLKAAANHLSDTALQLLADKYIGEGKQKAKDVANRREVTDLWLSNAQIVTGLLATKFPQHAKKLGCMNVVIDGVRSAVSFAGKGLSNGALAGLVVGTIAKIGMGIYRFLNGQPPEPDIREVINEFMKVQGEMHKQVMGALKEIYTETLQQYQTMMKELKSVGIKVDQLSSQIQDLHQEMNTRFTQLEGMIKAEFSYLSRDVLFMAPFDPARNKLRTTPQNVAESEFAHTLSVIQSWGTNGAIKFQDHYADDRSQMVAVFQKPVHLCSKSLLEYFGTVYGKTYDGRCMNALTWIEAVESMMQYVELKRTQLDGGNYQNLSTDNGVSPLQRTIPAIINELITVGQNYLTLVQSLQIDSGLFGALYTQYAQELRQVISSVNAELSKNTPFPKTKIDELFSNNKLAFYELTLRRFVDLAFFGLSEHYFQLTPQLLNFKSTQQLMEKMKDCVEKSPSQDQNLTALLQRQEDSLFVLGKVMESFQAALNQNASLLNYNPISAYIAELSELGNQYASNTFNMVELSDTPEFDLATIQLPISFQGLRIAIQLGWGDPQTPTSRFINQCFSTLDLSQTDELGKTLFHYACEAANELVLNRIMTTIETNQLYHQDHLGNYPLHYAALSGDRDTLQRIMSLGQPDDIVSLRNKLNQTPWDIIALHFPELKDLYSPIQFSAIAIRQVPTDFRELTHNNTRIHFSPVLHLSSRLVVGVVHDIHPNVKHETYLLNTATMEKTDISSALNGAAFQGAFKLSDTEMICRTTYSPATNQYTPKSFYMKLDSTGGIRDLKELTHPSTKNNFSILGFSNNRLVGRSGNAILFWNQSTLSPLQNETFVASAFDVSYVDSAILLSGNRIALAGLTKSCGGTSILHVYDLNTKQIKKSLPVSAGARITQLIESNNKLVCDYGIWDLNSGQSTPKIQGTSGITKLNNGLLAGYGGGTETVSLSPYPGTGTRCKNHFVVIDPKTMQPIQQLQTRYVSWKQLRDGRIILIQPTGQIDIADPSKGYQVTFRKPGALPQLEGSSSVDITQISPTRVLLHRRNSISVQKYTADKVSNEFFTVAFS